MSTVVAGAVLIVFAIMQTVIFPSLAPMVVMPNVVLVVILVWSAVRGLQEGMLWAFAIGIVLDTLALDPLGTNALALLPVVVMGSLAAQRFFQSGLLIPLLAATVGTLANAVILLLIRSAGGDSLALSAVGRVIVLQAVLNAIIVPPIYLAASMARRPLVSRYV